MFNLKKTAELFDYFFWIQGNRILEESDIFKITYNQCEQPHPIK